MALCRAENDAEKAQFWVEATAAHIALPGDIALEMAEMLAEERAWAQALTYTEQALAQAPGSFTPSAYHQKLIALMQLSEVETAFAWAKEAREWFKQHPDEGPYEGKILHNLALLHLQQGQNAEALEYFEAAIRHQARHREYAPLRLSLANLQIFIKEAMRPQNQLIFYNNHLAEARQENDALRLALWHLYRGLWYDEEDQKEAAFEDYLLAEQLFEQLEVHEWKGELHYYLGTLYEEKGQHPEAIRRHLFALEAMLGAYPSASAGMVVYYLQKSQDDIEDPALRQKATELLAEAQERGLDTQTDLAEAHLQEDESQEAYLAGEEASDLAGLSLPELEERYQEARKQPDVKAYATIAFLYLERLHEHYRSAWFSKKKKKEAFESAWAEVKAFLATSPRPTRKPFGPCLRKKVVAGVCPNFLLFKLTSPPSCIIR
ncbi:MAG: tetratricopeptide repeat protein [Microscillaceae bacterium]|nr:tetratricopeptide repeat protein [Microscillaceae bacterium]